MLDNTPNETSLRDYLDLLRRRKKIILQTFMIVVIFGLALTVLTRPLYRTSSRILVEGKEVTFAQVNTSDPLNGLFIPDNGHDVTTQIEVLQGDKVQADAYKLAGVRAGAVRLDIKQVNSTDVIEITAESNDSNAAVNLANALPKIYVNYIDGNRSIEIAQALKFAQSHLEEEQHRLNSAEYALQRFKERSHIADLQTDRSQHLNERAAAATDLHKIESQAQGLEARLNALLHARDSEPPSTTVATQSTNLQKQTVTDDIAKLQTERAKLLILNKPNEVHVQEVDAQIADLQKRFQAMPDLVTTVSKQPNLTTRNYYDEKIAETQADLAMARANLQATHARLNGDATLTKYSALERQQNQLQREIDRFTGTVTLLTKDVEDLSLRENAKHNPVVTISPATAAIQVAPKRAANMVYSVLIGLLLGFCFALLQEFLDDRVNTPEHARAALHAPIMGYVPLIEKEDARLLASVRTGSSVLESYRVLRSNVQFAAVDAPIRSILVTSTMPGEGKSLTASNLAVAMALDERRVILVDADLHRPTLHRNFDVGQRAGIGLTTVLVNRTPLEEALIETAIPGLRLLAAGPIPPNPAELLNSRAMRQLHAQLKEMADVVIFDSPPCLATADAQVLSAETDGVLYVVQFGVARRSAVHHAAGLLRQAHARVLGIVGNKIDLRSQRDDYYFGYYRYYDRYSTKSLETGTTDEGKALEQLLAKDSADLPENHSSQSDREQERGKGRA
jgi:capsular exopolysaccharide synthesis family protein